jgi:hypothetical protein
MKEKGSQPRILVEKKIMIPIPKPGNQYQQHSKQKDIEGKQNVQERFHSG